MNLADLELLGWWWKESPSNWAVRNLMQTEPSPLEGWEPVFVAREGAEELKAYRKALRGLVNAVQQRKETAMTIALAEAEALLEKTPSE